MLLGTPFQFRHPRQTYHFEKYFLAKKKASIFTLIAPELYKQFDKISSVFPGLTLTGFFPPLSTVSLRSDSGSEANLGYCQNCNPVTFSIHDSKKRY